MASIKEIIIFFFFFSLFSFSFSELYYVKPGVVPYIPADPGDVLLFFPGICIYCFSFSAIIVDK